MTPKYVFFRTMEAVVFGAIVLTCMVMLGNAASAAVIVRTSVPVRPAISTRAQPVIVSRVTQVDRNNSVLTTRARDYAAEDADITAHPAKPGATRVSAPFVGPSHVSSANAANAVVSNDQKRSSVVFVALAFAFVVFLGACLLAL